MNALRDVGRLILLCVGVRVALAYFSARRDERLDRMAREAHGNFRPVEDPHVRVGRRPPLFDWQTNGDLS
jgi:hypothetical protein